MALGSVAADLPFGSPVLGGIALAVVNGLLAYGVVITLLATRLYWSR